MSYLIGADVWEGSLDINEDAFLEGGCKYLLIRLNDMNGGHHKDTNFDAQWTQSTDFYRIPYFVYNPWVSGRDNWAWLQANLPYGVTTVCSDVEVAKDGYSPTEYANNVQTYTDLLQSSNIFRITYTGEWCKALLAIWPSNTDYWLARYPTTMYPAEKTSITWADLKTKVDSLTWYPSTPGAFPGPCRLWQCSGDRFIPTGSTRPVDINIFNGVYDEFGSYYNLPAIQRPTVAEEPVYDEEFALLVARIDELGERISNIDARVSALDTRISNIERRINEFEARFNTAETLAKEAISKANAVEVTVNNHSNRIAEILAKISRIKEIL